MGKSYGVNVRELIIRRMAIIMIPPGTGDGLATGLNALRKPGNLEAAAREAEQWVEACLQMVKQADNNPFGDDDEAIAAEVLRRIQKEGKP